MFFGRRKKFQLNNPERTYKVHYLGNVMTSLLKGGSHYTSVHASSTSKPGEPVDANVSSSQSSTYGSAHKSDSLKRRILDSPQSTNTAGNWINSVAALPNTDLFASGSDDGFIRVWAYSSASQRPEERFRIPLVSVVSLPP